MKWIFKTALLLALIVNLGQARELILIENISNIEDGEMVKSILKNKFYLPENFITLKSNLKKCSKNNESLLHICVTGPVDFQIMHINRYVLKSALGSIRELGEENEG